MTIKFKPGDKAVCIADNWRAIDSNGLAINVTATIRPKKGETYTVDEVREVNSKIALLFKEIPHHQEGYDQPWNQDSFEKPAEERVVYRVVEVEVDKRVKEKRKEIIFNN